MNDDYSLPACAPAVIGWVIKMTLFWAGVVLCCAVGPTILRWILEMYNTGVVLLNG